MWETMTDDIQQLGGQVLLNHRVTKLEFEDDRCVRVHVGDEVLRALGGDLVAAAAEHGRHGRARTRAPR